MGEAQLTDGSSVRTDVAQTADKMVGQVVDTVKGIIPHNSLRARHAKHRCCQSKNGNREGLHFVEYCFAKDEIWN